MGRIRESLKYGLCIGCKVLLWHIRLTSHFSSIACNKRKTHFKTCTLGEIQWCMLQCCLVCWTYRCFRVHKHTTPCPVVTIDNQLCITTSGPAWRRTFLAIPKDTAVREVSGLRSLSAQSRMYVLKCLFISFACRRLNGLSLAGSGRLGITFYICYSNYTRVSLSVLQTALYTCKSTLFLY